MFLQAAGTDMLSQALLSSDLSLSEDYVKVYHAGSVMVEGAADEERLVAVTQIESSQLRQLLQLEGSREWAAYPAR